MWSLSLFVYRTQTGAIMYKHICTLLCLTALSLAWTTDAFAQRRISCNDADTKKFVSNLLAKKLRKAKPYPTPVLKKAIWPYLMKTLDFRETNRSQTITEGANNFNHAYLAIHPNKTLDIHASVSKGKMGVTVCTYTWSGKGLSVVKANKLNRVDSKPSKTVTNNKSHYTRAMRAKRGRVSLIYISPANVAVYRLRISAAGGNR